MILEKHHLYVAVDDFQAVLVSIKFHSMQILMLEMLVVMLIHELIVVDLMVVEEVNLIDDF